MKKVRVAVWLSSIALLAIFFGLYFGMQPKLPEPIAIETEGQPTIGYPKAAVHIVAFLDPKCSDSKKYHNTLYPMIKEKYIETNKALYTVIPVSFIPDSMPAAVALLCAYYQSPDAPNPELFMTYLDYIYENQPPEHTDWTKPNKLLQFAKEASPAIRLGPLENCIDTEKYHDAIVKNTHYEKTLLGHVQAPVLFINGIRVEQVSTRGVKKLMKIALLAHGESP